MSNRERIKSSQPSFLDEKHANEAGGPYRSLTHPFLQAGLAVTQLHYHGETTLAKAWCRDSLCIRLLVWWLARGLFSSWRRRGQSLGLPVRAAFCCLLRLVDAQVVFSLFSLLSSLLFPAHPLFLQPSNHCLAPHPPIGLVKTRDPASPLVFATLPLVSRSHNVDHGNWRCPRARDGPFREPVSDCRAVGSG